MKTGAVRRVLGGLVWLAVAVWPHETDAAGVGACTRSAQLARKACVHESLDDLWTTKGRCLNTASPGARRECLVDAWAQFRDARGECREQWHARKDVCDALGEAPYDPRIDPAEFLAAGEIAASPNPYFPLVPGTTFVYHGGAEVITVTVTHETRKILGVECVVVEDVVEEDGEVIEHTLDWYAQDVHGNVWYFGELAMNYEGGELVSLDGSWKAGRDLARPGILVPAAPVVGAVYRQEFLLGEAEDLARVLSLSGSVAVPAASCSGDCLVTLEFTPLEPDAREHKFYAPGFGLVLEENPDTGERVELVAISGP